MDPERATILSRPLSALESLEAMHHQRSPRLVHREAHTIVFMLLEERLIVCKDFVGFLILLNDGTFHSLSKLIKGILILQSCAQRAVDLVKHLRLLLFHLFISLYLLGFFKVKLLLPLLAFLVATLLSFRFFISFLWWDIIWIKLLIELL